MRVFRRFRWAMQIASIMGKRSSITTRAKIQPPVISRRYLGCRKRRLRLRPLRMGYMILRLYLAQIFKLNSLKSQSISALSEGYFGTHAAGGRAARNLVLLDR